jgi:class 3 adenylate cyclase
MRGGTVVKLMGDDVMAAFGVPRVAEDDAIRAVCTGMAMQDAFRELVREEFTAVGATGSHVGINAGEVVVVADNADVVGDPVNVGARHARHPTRRGARLARTRQVAPRRQPGR